MVPETSQNGSQNQEKMIQHRWQILLRKSKPEITRKITKICLRQKVRHAFGIVKTNTKSMFRCCPPMTTTIKNDIKKSSKNDPKSSENVSENLPETTFKQNRSQIGPKSPKSVPKALPRPILGSIWGHFWDTFSHFLKSFSEVIF